MARPESLMIGGYYAFPQHHISHLGALFADRTSNFASTRILDPCAGEGEAIVGLAQELRAKKYVTHVYGIELEQERAAEAARRIEEFRAATPLMPYESKGICDDIYLANITNESFGIIFVNPPFTWDTAVPGQRREFGMLKHAWQWLQPDGWMIFVSYNHHLRPDLLTWVGMRSSELHIYRLPELHFDTYCYTVLLARKATSAYNVGPYISERIEMVQSPERIPMLQDAEPGKFYLPRFASFQDWSGNKFTFKQGEIRPNDIIGKLATGQGAERTQAFQSAMMPPPDQHIVRPAMTVRRGHLLTLAASGMFNYVRVRGQNGIGGVLRSVIRRETKLIKTEVTERGKSETYQIVPVAHACILHDDGNIEYFKSETEMLNLLERYGDQLMEHVTQTYKPRYTLRGETPQKRRWLPHMARQLVKGAHPFLPAQQHIGAAVLALLDEVGRALLVGQMSVGKTAVSLAVMDAWHREGRIKPGQVVWVNCPNMTVKKWAREARLQIPGVQITLLALEIDKKRIDMMAELSRAMREAEAHPDKLHLIIAAQDAIKLGEGWKPAYVERKSKILCPTTYDVFEPDDKDIGKEADDILKKRQQWLNGNPLWQEVRQFGLPKGHNGRAKVIHVTVNGKVQRQVVSVNGEPIYDEWLALKGVRMDRNPRGPVWRLLKKRYKGRIAIAFFDETHQSNNIATDRYRAMSAIAHAADRVVGLSGTIFSGYASSIYGLETVFDPELFRSYEWGTAGLNRWVRDMGVLERVVEDVDEYRSNGTYSGTKRVNHAAREAPGASPLLVQRIIGHTVFLNLADLGQALPDLTEYPAPVSMTKEQAAHYAEARRKAGDYLRRCTSQGDNTFTGAYYHGLMKYPDHATEWNFIQHRKQVVSYTGKPTNVAIKTVAEIPAISGPLPKESWLLSLVKQELSEGRGIGLYVTHSGTSLQQRLCDLLTAAGAKPVILTAAVKAVDREEWIEKAFADGANVLICNPRLVETGLDLIMCPTLIFFEPEAQFGVLKQAAHRHWRIPQTKPCRTYYAYYSETFQERLTAKTARKLKAHHIVNGESAALSALNEMEDWLDDLLTTDGSMMDLNAEFEALNRREWDDSEWLDGIVAQAKAAPPTEAAPSPPTASNESANQIEQPDKSTQHRSKPTQEPPAKSAAEPALRLERSEGGAGRGGWWWLYGNTHEHRDMLKAAGGRWSAARRAWWFASDNVPSEVQALVNQQGSASAETLFDLAAPAEQQKPLL